MSFNLLVIGRGDTIKKVNTAGREYKQLNLVSIQHNELQSKLIKNIQWRNFDGVFYTEPVPISLHVSLIKTTGDLPVFKLQFSVTALYAGLLKYFYECSETPMSYPISVDFFGEESMKAQIEDEGMGRYLAMYMCDIYQTPPERLIDHHTELWEMGKVQGVLTGHEEVYRRLREKDIKTWLLTPSLPCIEEALIKVQSALNHLQNASPELPFRVEDFASLAELKRIGVSGATLHKLHSLCQAKGTNRLTTAELARGFSITMRSARRILTTLEEHKVAAVIGEEQLHNRGRPRYVYDINFDYFKQSLCSFPALG
ncbi:hypothetical protein Q7A53_08095 [Halobacillus rhizosphaerae]|uniref:hypothetical protein n=1 Tax=Halobacillus rhizosphaerae TaxID=3064889 RepID=UPI00398B195B